MKIVHMECEQVRQLADSYLSDELIVETNHQIISHLEHCADCRRELAARRELRTRLREAFTTASENQIRPEFLSRLSEQLRDQALGRRIDSARSADGLRLFHGQRRIALLALAACLVLAIGIALTIVWQRTSLFTHPGPQEIGLKGPTPDNSGPDSGVPVNLVKTELARSAVGDHRDCAIHFRLEEKPIDLEVAGHKYDPVYINLAKAVLPEGKSPLDVEVVEAHSCIFEGRRFAHIVLKYRGRLVSLLVTEGVTEVTPPTPSQSQVIACSQFDGYQVSCFQTARHAVFVVSDLPEGENLGLARAVAPSVYAHITRIESGV